jgi:hypothetical protein
LFTIKNKRKKEATTFLCRHLLPSNKNLKMKEKDGVFFFSSTQKKKKKPQRKKNHKEEKKCREGKEFTFLLLLYIWDKAFLLPSPLHIPLTLSSPPSPSLVSHVSSKLYAT